MESNNQLNTSALKTILHECRQCGACCKKFRKIRLYPDEVEFIKKMGGHVGIDTTLAQLREKKLASVIEESKSSSAVYMIHPNDKGCVFRKKIDGKYNCSIYYYRPRTCRLFQCNMADSTFLNIFGQDATALLGLDRFGLPILK
jgi:Fe-S-cluster containining protein